MALAPKLGYDAKRDGPGHVQATHAFVPIPISPKKCINIVFTEAVYRFRHLALKRKPAHFSVGHDLETYVFLKSNSLIYCLIFDSLELCLTKLTSSYLVSSMNELLRTK
jgi:hypothetical protein